MDSTNNESASLVYKVVENDGDTNFNLPKGTISFWFSPNWSGTNAGGVGPCEQGRFFEIGTYTTNASIGWLSLYLDPNGSTVYFAGQTNNGSGASYFAAPVTLTNHSWNYFVLTYGPTNTALYMNGLLLTNGSGLAYYPDSYALSSGIAIGSSAVDGHSQIHGMLDDLSTYNWEWDSNVVYLTYQINGLAFFGPPPFNPDFLTNGPSSPSTGPTFKAVTGLGFLQLVGSNSSGCVTSSNIWLTNISAVAGSNQTTVTFTIAGGSNNVVYDVFGTAGLLSPITNSTWAWLGQGYHCSTYNLTLQSNSTAFFILGKPQDTDGDGLTDAYELLVSKSDPNKASTTGNGILDGWAVLWGLDPKVDATEQSSVRANYTYDLAGRLKTLFGARTETIGFDGEGNIKDDSQ